MSVYVRVNMIFLFDADRNFSEENIQRLTKGKGNVLIISKSNIQEKIIHPIFSNQDMIHITYDFYIMQRSMNCLVNEQHRIPQ